LYHFVPLDWIDPMLGGAYARLMARPRVWRVSVVVSVLVLAGSGTAQRAMPELVRTAVWGGEKVRGEALAEVGRRRVTKAQFDAAEVALRRGRAYSKPIEGAERLDVAIGDGRELRVDVQLPSDYDPKRAYPIMVAMGGGPLPSVRSAQRQGQMMASIWRRPAATAEWIVATITDSVSIVAKRSPLRYPILQDAHFKAVLDAVRGRFHVDVNRVHATGVSLGSNYSLHYAAAHPDWFAGVVPVSTEGESREWVLRCLNRVGVYVLEGVRDRNIRDIAGPRKLKQILAAFGTPHVYVEDPKRGHESFRELYPEVLAWLTKRPRNPFPTMVIRMAHPGIVMPAKRFFWIGTDAHQAMFEASVDRAKNEISILVARATRVSLFLADRLVDLGRPVIVRINGEVAHAGRVERSLSVAVEDLRRTRDPQRFATAILELKVGNTRAGEDWLATRKPRVEPARLAYWEMFAMDTLKERAKVFPARIESDQGGVRVVAAPSGCALRKGDLLLVVDGEPMFEAGSVAFLKSWLVREPRRRLTCMVRRGDSTTEIVLEL
jgi:pimeloyl-ACP methyl ester carboxylesterase